MLYAFGVACLSNISAMKPGSAAATFFVLHCQMIRVGIDCVPRNVYIIELPSKITASKYREVQKISDCER